MSKRYPGGYIFRSNPTIVGPTNGEGGSAPGVWTLEQASYYTKLGMWPQKVIPRTLYSWGYNGSGELGQNDTIPRSSPVQIGSITVNSVESFNGHTLMIDSQNLLFEIAVINSLFQKRIAKCGAILHLKLMKGQNRVPFL